MSQLSFDLAMQSAQRATDHADRVSPKWSTRALAAIYAHALRHEEFTTEDVIEASPWIPRPPDKRAWGHVALAAKKQGIVNQAGIGRSKLVHAHGRWITRWCSLVCAVEA